MVGFTNLSAHDVYLARFRNTTLAGLPLDQWVALLYADPGDDLSNWQEADFGGYGRRVTRFTDDQQQNGRGSNLSDLLWTPTSNSNMITHWAACLSSDTGSGASSAHYIGIVRNPKAFVAGVEERFAAGSLIIDANAN